MDYEIEMTDIAAGQWGLITAQQARGVGATPNALARLTARGALERIAHGVYRIGGTPPSSLDGLRADWLALDPGVPASDRLWESADVSESLAIVSHRSAARLHDLGDIDADDHEFTVSVRKQTRRSTVRIHRFPIGEDDWTIVDGLPVTSPLRTIDDLAAARIDGGHLAGIVRDALANGIADDEQVARVLRRHARFYGAPMGDGMELLSSFLQEAGVPMAVTRLAAFADGSRSTASGAAGPLATLTSPEFQAELARSVSAGLEGEVRAALRRVLSEALGGDPQESLRAALGTGPGSADTADDPATDDTMGDTKDEH